MAVRHDVRARLDGVEQPVRRLAVVAVEIAVLAAARALPRLGADGFEQRRINQLDHGYTTLTLSADNQSERASSSLSSRLTRQLSGSGISASASPFR